jgi:hypothetical protein
MKCPEKIPLQLLVSKYFGDIFGPVFEKDKVYFLSMISSQSCSVSVTEKTTESVKKDP